MHDRLYPFPCPLDERELDISANGNSGSVEGVELDFVIVGIKQPVEISVGRLLRLLDKPVKRDQATVSDTEQDASDVSA